MQQFWFCEGCKSMNRVSSDWCYRCGAPKATMTMATVNEAASGAVLTPQLDEEHREVAWALMARHSYTSAWGLGYFAAGLLFLTVAVAVALFAAEVALMLSHRTLDPLSITIDPDSVQLTALRTGAFAFIGTAIAAVVAHSIFLALTSTNTAALGSGSARFSVERAAWWWIESYLWAIRAGLAFIVPPLLCILAIGLIGIVPGLILGAVWFACAFAVLGDPISSLGKPKRLLEDLYGRLALKDSPDSRMVSLWAMAWGTARGVSYAVASGTYILLLLLTVMQFIGYFAGFRLTSGSNAEINFVAILIRDIIVVTELVADGIALILLARVTLELAHRQRVREEWVLSGVPLAEAGVAAAKAAKAAGQRLAAETPIDPATATGITATAESMAPSLPPAPPAPAAPASAVPAWVTAQVIPAPAQTALEASEAGSDEGEDAETEAATPEIQLLRPSSTATPRYGMPPQVAAPPADEQADAPAPWPQRAPSPWQTEPPAPKPAAHAEHVDAVDADWPEGI
jgi:hypothetical protein